MTPKCPCDIDFDRAKNSFFRLCCRRGIVIYKHTSFFAFSLCCIEIAKSHDKILPLIQLKGGLNVA